MTNKKWQVPYINLGKQFHCLEQELTAEFKRVMTNGEFILRDDVKKFEENMTSYLQVKHIIGVNSGTDALYLAVEALGIQPNDEIITVANTFVATATSIVRRGAKPVFIDICDDFNMDVDQIEKRITDKTKAIIPVHLNGRSCKMDVLEQLAKKYDLDIIEDAAQSLGTEYQNKKVGSYGDLGCFSLHPLKSLSCAGDGGFISTNDDKLAEKLRILRDHGQKEKGEFLCFGFNSRLDNLQAAILNVKMRNFQNNILRRREIAETYQNSFEGLPLTLPPKPSIGEHYDTYTSYVIRTDKRDDLLKHLRSNGIEAFVHIPKPLYKHSGLKLKDAHLVKNERICSENLSIPIYPELSSEEINYVTNNIHNFFTK